ncbi:DUF222 domain-containing protein [Propionibacteriaceae bacterium G57]|uniref:DUF222 domain-containing protein n=1 Tax=Aestuariimicrobium sp. G57 TaxID=3418485 RepID=UPI003DA7A6A1
MKGLIRVGFDKDAARQRLVSLREARQARFMAEATELRCYAELAEQYQWVPEDGDGPVLHGEQMVRAGGDGTPEIAEFTAMEVAGALGMSVDTAHVELFHAVATKYRFPRLWQMVMQGRLRAFKATTIAVIGSPLTFEQALQLDEELAPMIATGHFSRHEKYARARVMQMQTGKVQDDHEQALASRRVDIGQPHLGVTDVHARLLAADGVHLNAALNRIATILGQGGNEESHDVRRATALGILASPAYALSLLQASLVEELPEGLAQDCPAAGMSGHTCGQITVDPDRLLPRSEVIVHLSEDTAGTGEGVARAEKIGPILAGWIKELVGHSRITVRPVLDCNGVQPTDSYEVPAAMRRAVTLRNPTEVFPWSAKSSTGRGIDLDHTIPWGADQPHGQKPTRVENLGPLSRKVHRAKTHGGWQLAQPIPGVFLWRSPLGFTYLVTPSQTWMVDDPTGRILANQNELAAA